MSSKEFKVKEIIGKLCSHEISKQDAIDQINIIANALIKNNALEFTVEESGFTLENNHGYLKLKLPYQYAKMERRVKRGDKVNVLFLSEDDNLLLY